MRARLLPNPLPLEAAQAQNTSGEPWDLLGDGSLRVVGLPGHARGQIGLLARTESGSVLLAANGAWHSRAIRELRPPSRLTEWLQDDPLVLRARLERLHAFARAHPEVLIVLTHCPEIFALLGAAIP